MKIADKYLNAKNQPECINHGILKIAFGLVNNPVAQAILEKGTLKYRLPQSYFPLGTIAGVSPEQKALHMD